MRVDVLGVGFDDITLDEAAKKAGELISGDGRGYVVTPNTEIVMMCRKNAALLDAVKNADIVLPDGVGIKYGAEILGRPIRGTVPGIEFGEELLRLCAQNGWSVYFLGAKPGVAEKAAENMREKYPGLTVAGTADGYFKDDAPVIEAINEVKPDILFVCLGAPKQELWMVQNLEKLDVHIAVGLGGSLDVFAGVAERAPERWRKLGLEWLYRLKKEPKRIGRMMKLPQFILIVTGRRLFHGGR